MPLSRQLCLAPMIDWTDKHFRFFMRLVAPHALLYSEMITTGAIIHGDKDRHLNFNEQEHPVALQLGGCDPKSLAECAKIGEQYGYDEVNLNVGCPSNRVQSGKFGACLMREPELVRDCVAAMQDMVTIPVTVKSRIGVDEHETYEDLYGFVKSVAESGCQTFIIHARKAWLKGLSPKQNRNIPPLKYDFVYRLKKEFPDLEVIINGGIRTIEEVNAHLTHIDGVMLGRLAYEDPYVFAQIDEAVFQEDILGRVQVVKAYQAYMDQQLKGGVKLSMLVRPMINLFNGLPGSKGWRRHLSTNSHKKDANLSIVDQSLSYLDCI